VWLKIALRYPIAWSHASLVKCYMDPVHKNRMRRERLFSREPAISQTARAALASGRLTPEQADRLRELAAGYQMLAALHCLRQGKKTGSPANPGICQGHPALPSGMEVVLDLAGPPAGQSVPCI
jgi:hypothetical protein